MDIKQTASHLQRLGQPFDVIITKNGVSRELYTNLQPTDVEGLLNDVLSEQQPDAIIIQERKRNGSTNIKQGQYPVTLGGLEQNTPIQTPAPMQNQNIPSTFQDYLIKELEKKNEKLEKKVDKLENENDKLKNDNFELLKENKYKDKEFELSKKEVEFEKSNGLAGIMETVTTNPALATLVATAAGRLMGVDIPPMGSVEGGQPQASSSSEGSTQEQIAGHIKEWLLKLDEETATTFFKVTNEFAQEPSQIATVLNLLESNHE